MCLEINGAETFVGQALFMFHHGTVVEQPFPAITTELLEEPEVIADGSDLSVLKHPGLDGATGIHNRSPPTRRSGLPEQISILI